MILFIDYIKKIIAYSIPFIVINLVNNATTFVDMVLVNLFLLEINLEEIFLQALHMINWLLIYQNLKEVERKYIYQ